MKLGIMQPYFLPYIGYFSLIKHTDCFILFDTVQFIHHGWIERNRILKPQGGWQYINVPLEKHDLQALIKDIEIKNSENWRDRIFAQIQHYKKKSPFYNETVKVISNGLNIETTSIVKLNYSVLKSICEYLEIPFNCKIFSEMNLKIEKVNAPDEWALNICKLLGASEYWNPEGGLDFFNKEKYEREGIKINFLKHNLPFYSQRRGIENFENSLSILDVLMFNSVEDVNRMLDDFELV